MEIFGLGCALDVAPGSKRSGGGRGDLHCPRGEAEDLLCSDRPASVFPRLRQALLRKWELAESEHRTDSGRQAIGADGTHFRPAAEGQTHDAPEHPHEVLASVPPTPSEVLSASSIRMMLGMASAFRGTNPAVLEVMCGTMIDLLLEAPPLVLAPLHEIPSSIEANTFRRVGEFCAELLESSDNDEREPALGLYLALAISRGQVSGLLELVRVLLQQCRREGLEVQDLGVVAGEVLRSPSPLGCESSLSKAAAVGAAESDRGRRGDGDARISAVLDRLADHGDDFHLSFPDGWEGTRLAIRVPRVAPEGSSVSTPDRSVSRQYIERECLASAAVDGKFVFIWHPEIGLLKVGTGLGGTVKERVYEHNSQAGRQDKPVKSTGSKGGLVAVIGDTLFLQTGLFVPPYQFLVVRTSTLEVARTVNVLGLPLPRSIATGGGVDRYARDGERKAVDAARGENRTPSGDAVWQGSAQRHVPLCCDGRMVYAIVPSEANGRPSIVAVDIANTGRVRGRPVELERPTTDVGKTDLPTAQSRGDVARVVNGNDEPLGTGGSPDSCTPPKEWAWWQNDGGAKLSARTFCTGNSIVVCWVDDPEIVATPANPTARLRFRRAGTSGGLGGRAASPNSTSGAGQANSKTNSPGVAHMARFNLFTGECERVGEDPTDLAGSWGSAAPWMAYEKASFVIRCELRRMPPSRAGERHEVSVAVERRVFLWWNRGLMPRPPHGGRFGWRWALGNLADDPGDGAAGPRSVENFTSLLSDIAVFVLAHLVRLGEHHLEWDGEGSHAGGAEFPMPSPQGRRTSVPFCYDLAPETFTHLVGLVEMFAGCFEAPVSNEEGRADEEAEVALPGGLVGLYVLCAALRLLNINVGILLSRGLGAMEFGGENARHSLLRCLLSLVQHCEPDRPQGDFPPPANSWPPSDEQVGRAAVAGEALRLLVDRIDFFYPLQEHQASLLFSYLRAYGTGDKSHTVASRAVMLELLARMASQPFLRSLLQAGGRNQLSSGAWARNSCSLGPGLMANDDPPRGPDTIDGFAEALLELSRTQFVRDIPQIATGVSAAEYSATAGAKNLARGVRSSLSWTEVGMSVVDALGAVLNLRCIDAFSTTKGWRSEGGVHSIAEFRKFLQLVLQASQEILSAAIEAQASSAAVAGGAVPERVVEALRGSLVGTLLPSCLASALALLDAGGKDRPRIGVTDLLDPSLQEHLVHVTFKLRVFATSGWSVRDVEAESSSVWPIDEFEGTPADLRNAAGGGEPRADPGGDRSTTEHRPREASIWTIQGHRTDTWLPFQLGHWGMIFSFEGTRRGMTARLSVCRKSLCSSRSLLLTLSFDRKRGIQILYHCLGKCWFSVCDCSL